MKCKGCLFYRNGEYKGFSINDYCEKHATYCDKVSQDKKCAHLPCTGGYDYQSPQRIQKIHVSQQQEKRDEVGDHGQHHEYEDSIPEYP